MRCSQDRFPSTGRSMGRRHHSPLEDALFHRTSLYGASKLACEGLIAAYCEAFGFKVGFFVRIVLGERYTRENVFDFLSKTAAGPDWKCLVMEGSENPTCTFRIIWVFY